jgi:hypothetical protein
MLCLILQEDESFHGVIDRRSQRIPVYSYSAMLQRYSTTIVVVLQHFILNSVS